MTTDTKELRRLAEAATKGPWVHTESNSDCCDYEVWQQPQCASLIAGEYGIKEECDAAYIAAANPAAVLSLLDANDILTQQLATLRESLENCLREHGGYTIKGETERVARAALAATAPAAREGEG